MISATIPATNVVTHRRIGSEMRSGSKFFLLLAGLILIFAVLLKWQRQAAAQLRDEIASRRDAADEWTRLNAEHRHLVASQVKPDDVKKLAADRHAVSALLGEIEAMKRRADSTARSTKQPSVEKPVQSSMERGPVPASLWKNAGQATPAAAFETVLWASAGGDLDSLARVLDLDSLARTDATEMLDQLPPAIRQEIGTPERLIALMTAKDAPLGSAEILSADDDVSAGAPILRKLDARVVDVTGEAKELLLRLRADNGRWRLVVPDNAIKKYASLLQAPVEPSGSTGRTPR
jgi:cell division protein FtsL